MASVIDKAKYALQMGKKKDKTKLVGQDIYPVGYGLMGLTWRSNPLSQETSFASMSTMVLAV